MHTKKLLGKINVYEKFASKVGYTSLNLSLDENLIKRHYIMGLEDYYLAVDGVECPHPLEKILKITGNRDMHQMELSHRKWMSELELKGKSKSNRNRNCNRKRTKFY